MRLADDARKCVVFLGNRTDPETSASALHRDYTATGFFLYHEAEGASAIYLVTAKHVAKTVGEPPLWIRFNKAGTGDAFLHEVDEADWHYHSDDTVDLALLRFSVPAEADVTAFPTKFLIRPTSWAAKRIGPGDLTYVVGLFKRLPGTKRSLPVVHTGHLALVPDSGERIPVTDWDQPSGRKEIEAVLVQAQTLSGSSGSPVFIKRGIKVLPVEETGVIPKAFGAVFLLGVWQGSFEARPDELMASDLGVGKSDRVSVNYGVVIPAHKIDEILDMPKAKEERARHAKPKPPETPGSGLDFQNPEETTLYVLGGPQVVEAEVSAMSSHGIEEMTRVFGTMVSTKPTSRKAAKKKAGKKKRK